MVGAGGIAPPLSFKREEGQVIEVEGSFGSGLRDDFRPDSDIDVFSIGAVIKF